MLYTTCMQFFFSYIHFTRLFLHTAEPPTAQPCLKCIIIFVGTADENLAESNDKHKIRIVLKNEMKEKALTKIPARNGQATYAMDLKGFAFSNDCITIGDIQKVLIIADGDDEWLIRSIVTEFSDGYKKYRGTRDIGVDQWINNEHAGSSQEFQLTLDKP